MPKLAFVVAASLMLLVLLPLSTFSVVAHAQGTVAAELGKPFEVQIGQQATIDSENIAINFINVTEDSRCPSDVVCIWQGQASTKMSVVINSTDIMQFILTIGVNERSATFGGSKYSIEMTKLEPYPVSTNQKHPEDYVATLVVSKMAINSSRVFIKAAASNQDAVSVAAISGWNLKAGKGTLVILNHESATNKLAIARFTPTEAQCKIQGARECIDGRIAEARGIDGNTLHFEVSGNTLYLSAGGRDYSLDIRQLKTRSHSISVTLSEGQRDGPLLVQEIGVGYVKGLNFVEYPLALQDGIPVTLYVSDTVSNGCTVMLTLQSTHQDKAVFSKTVDYKRPCPL